MTSTALSSRQNRFVQAYCGHLNASRAAREAGYAASSGADAVTGHRLLRNAKARRAIEALQRAKAMEMEIVRIPRQTGHRFHANLDSDTTAIWTLIPGQTGQSAVAA